MNERGIPRLTLPEREKDPRSPLLHRQLGIRTKVHRQVVLSNAYVGSFYERRTYDPITRAWSSNHLYRASVTLAA